MNERWKYQIKSGGFYALVMALLFSVWEIYTTSLEEAILSRKFLIRLTAFLLVGIFVIGYFNWKAKVNNNTKR